MGTSASFGTQVQLSSLAPAGETTASKNTCRSARRALVFYRLRHATWVQLRHTGGGKAQADLSIPKGCPYTRWLVKQWKQRSYNARKAYYRWREAQERFLLRDFEFRPGNRAWHKAVEEVQRPYPGTAGWLLSCSAAEGGHGRWVGYGGQGYSSWLRDSDTVGGPMQFRWSTFKGMYRHALDDLRRRGYLVPQHLQNHQHDITWRSALGQALAAGWARYTGNDNSHWSASWGNGC